jgi:exopolysaccharide biosynthesis polyprenyl glycosylphosphotransferase
MATVTVPLTNGAATLSLGDDERITPRNRGRPSATSPLAAARHRIAIWTALCRVLDSVSALAVLILIFVVTNLASMPRGLAAFLAVRVTLRSLLLLTTFAIVWRLTFAFFGLYDAAQLRSWREEAKRVVAACSVGTLCALIFPLSSTSGRFDLETLGLFFLGVTAVTLLMRWLVLITTQVDYGQRHVIIVGSGPRALACYDDLRGRPGNRYEVLGFVDTNAAEWPPALTKRMLGSLEHLEAVLAQSLVDEVHIALPVKSCYDQFQQVIQICECAGVPVIYQLDAFRHGGTASRLDSSRGAPIVTTIVVPKEDYLVVKRALDIATAAFALLLLSPLMLAIVVGIKATSPGPVVFTQKRFGKGKRPFKMYKFRSMRVDAEALLHSSPVLYDEYRKNGFKLPEDQDPRITPLGRILRKTSLDELPQLWNVLRGEMAIVGPRPIVPGELDHYGSAACLLLALKPGLTGAWVVGGRSQIGYPHRAELELQYVRNWNLWQDVAIIARTIPMILSRRGAH